MVLASSPFSPQVCGAGGLSQPHQAPVSFPPRGGPFGASQHPPPFSFFPFKFSLCPHQGGQATCTPPRGRDVSLQPQHYSPAATLLIWGPPLHPNTFFVCSFFFFLTTAIYIVVL